MAFNNMPLEVIFQIIYQLEASHISRVTFQMAFHKDLSLIFHNLEEEVFQVATYHSMVIYHVLYLQVSQMACQYLKVFQTAYLIIFQIIYLNRGHLYFKEVYRIKVLYHRVVFQLYHDQVEHHMDMKVIEVLMDLQIILVNRVIFNMVFQVFHRV